MSDDVTETGAATVVALYIPIVLSPREQNVVNMRFGLDGGGPGTYRQIAHELGLKEARVKRIERAALRKLAAISEVRESLAGSQADAARTTTGSGGQRGEVEPDGAAVDRAYDVAEMGAADPDPIATAVAALRVDELTGLSALQATEKLIANRLALLPDRDRHVLESRMGLGGTEVRTLANLGEEFGVTRERVRQIEKSARQALAEMPLSDSIRMSDVLAELTTLKEFEFTAQEAVGRQCRAIFRSMSARTGDDILSLDQFVARVVARADPRLASLARIDRVRPWLDGQDQACWLSDDWFWRRPRAGENRYAQRTRKILSVSPSVSLEVLYAALSRSDRAHQYRTDFPEELFGRLIEQADRNFRVSGGHVSARSRIRSESVLNNMELKISRALNALGGVGTLRQLEASGSLAGVNTNTFKMALYTSPIIVRLGPSVYGFAGRDTDGSVLEPLIAEAQAGGHPWVNRGEGWTPSGHNRLELQLRGQSGVPDSTIYVPKRVLQFFPPIPDSGDQAATPLDAEDESGTIWTWRMARTPGPPVTHHLSGLGPYFRSAGAVAGDYLQLEYDDDRTRYRVAVRKDQLPAQLVISTAGGWRTVGVS